MDLFQKLKYYVTVIIKYLLTSSKSQVTGDRSVIFLKFERVTTSPNLKIGFCNLHPKEYYIYMSNSQRPKIHKASPNSQWRKTFQEIENIVHKMTYFIRIII